MTNKPADHDRRQPDPDQAWKALGLVNDWIRHAETKTTATLAAAGVSGGVLYNLVQHQTNPSPGLCVVAVLCGLAIVTSAGSAIMALAPRLRPGKTVVQPAPEGDDPARPPDDPANLLFFSHITRDYRGDAPSYAQVLSTLTSDHTKLTEQIGRQVHANADVAQRKYWWANCAIIALGIDLTFLALTAIVVANT
ncbi:MAG TPA: Pycsar system effector family protein [Streptosporangiaceae bacterium]